METLLVWIIVGMAGLFLFRRFLGQFRTAGNGCCGSSCSGCPSKGKPGPYSETIKMCWTVDNERRDQ